MTHIGDLPTEVGNFGKDFNYAVWSPNTHVTLANVPWNSDYRDVVKFADQNALNNYLQNNSGPVVRISHMTYARAGVPVRLDIPFNVAQGYNYIYVHNGAQPIDGSAPQGFYYFINDVRYIAPNTTELDIQLDVWQTFHYGARFGNCYIERGHIGIANERQFENNGRDYLSVPEGLDVGGEYVIEQTYSHFLADSENYAVLIVSTVSLEDSRGTMDAPTLVTARPNFFEGLPNGAAIYYADNRSEFRLMMNALSTIPWVSQGIVSIMAIPRIPSAELEWDDVQIGENVTTTVKKLKQFQVPSQRIMLASNWRVSLDFGRYSHLKKFLTYPYTVIEATTYTGTPLSLKPESMSGDALEFVLNMHLAPPAPRVSYYPLGYNTNGRPFLTRPDGSILNDRGEFLDMQTGIMNMPTFALVNNGAIAYLAQNANSIAYQHRSADWSQQRALQGNEISAMQSQASIDASIEQTRTGNRAAASSTALANQTAGLQALTGVVSGGVSGGPAGAVASAAGQAANLAIGTHQRNSQLDISTGLASAQNRISAATQGFVRDTNKEYADFAARGDYANTIAAINAKVQDAQMIQPTTSGQMGGDAFNLVAYRWGLDVKVKRLQGAALASIGEFWLRYGYAVHRFARMPDDLMVMTKFTYWKLRETYIQAAGCPENYKQTLRGIFEKGVTVWANPHDIGMVDVADNAPKAGITL